MREAQAAARLNHPGIVTLYEMGEEDGNALLVTELVDGDTLAQLNRDCALSDREIGEIGADLCEALDHAHCRSVVHRDIKPQNVLVTEDGEPRAKLMDFGVARLTDAAALTAPGDVVGTLAYMSPEQAEGRAAGPRGRRLLAGADALRVLERREPDTAARPRRRRRARSAAASAPCAALRPDLPRELSDAVDACLQTRPDRRPPLEELGGAIESSLDRLAEDPPRADPLVAPAPRRGRRRRACSGAWLAAGHGVLLP